MDPIITSLSSSTHADNSILHEESDHHSPAGYRYKKVHVPLAYPSEAIKEQFTSSKTYVYPPLMSPSDEFFSHYTSNNQPASPTSSQPINIPQGRQRQGEPGARVGRRNSMPAKPLSSSSSKSGSMPTVTSMPSPPTSPWKRSGSFSKPNRAATTLVLDETPYPDLPTDVRSWTSSHVAEYLGYSLRLYPRAITEDLGRYVRQSANLNGSHFLDLREEDLERMQINLKWRSMIMKAVGMLRRETIRASRIDDMNWQDGYDPAKDGPTPSPSVHSDEEPAAPSIHHSASATAESEITHVQERSTSSNSNDNAISALTSTINDTIATNMERSKNQDPIDMQELRRGIVEDISGILLSWKKEQEALAKKKAEASLSGRLGFMEGIVIGGLIVAFMMRFSR
ncbi:hypothetical protein BGZ80_002962 [Entomortierella chlamydospora]|uniref:SAM domain-containing protein n=1 Tax=Entomortierella chlamydospora TaxID=101097 RepID=A0A9P6N205_9FUNG|nr:hypothetical protein BGZ79_003563 [Entomortierella chlamydospora]KAG0021138.1 hypothetical protein BGZ80_002962 [Entomortierella chlamydospora]